jgi:hypothetical protein
VGAKFAELAWKWRELAHQRQEFEKSSKSPRPIS